MKKNKSLSREEIEIKIIKEFDKKTGNLKRANKLVRGSNKKLKDLLKYNLND